MQQMLNDSQSHPELQQMVQDLEIQLKDRDMEIKSLKRASKSLTEVS
jgi:hypothetical protein